MNPLIYQMAKAEKSLEENFTVGGRTYLVRCPKCKRENYAMAVSSGVCAWCGYSPDEGAMTEERARKKR